MSSKACLPPLCPTLALAGFVLLSGSVPMLAGVSGSATLSGDTPAEYKIKMNADPKCEDLYDGEEVLSSYYIVGSSGQLANVVVFLRDVPEGDYPVPETPVILSQRGCLYTPQASVIQVDQVLQIKNDDEHLHNVRALARNNRPFNLAQPGTGIREKTFKVTEEALKFKCDVHPWMESFVFVLDHPFFAVTAEDGKYDISGVPAGTYTLVAWHSRLGEQTQEITVGADSSAAVDFSFEAPE